MGNTKDAGPFEAWWDDYHGEGDVCMPEIEDAFIAGRRHQMEADAQIVDNQYERDGYIVQYDAAEAIREQEIENR